MCTIVSGVGPAYRCEEAERKAAEAEKRAQDLSWQIRMIAEPQRIGGTADRPGRVAGLLVRSVPSLECELSWLDHANKSRFLLVITSFNTRNALVSAGCVWLRADEPSEGVRSLTVVYGAITHCPQHWHLALPLAQEHSLSLPNEQHLSAVSWRQTMLATVPFPSDRLVVFNSKLCIW